MNEKNKLKEPIMISCHDAGASNLILHWLLHNKFKSIYFNLSGPATHIFKNYYKQLKNHSLDDNLKKTKTLISGTGWSSNHEHKARIFAKQNKIKSIAVIDHWVNYKERFNFDNQKIYPDELWLSDDYAYYLAKEHFSGIILKKINNYYLKDLSTKIKKKTISYSDNFNKVSKNVLYVLEPIRQKWEGYNKIPGEFQALNFFLSNMHVIGLDYKCNISLRLHPSEKKGKYDQWIKRQKNFRIKLSPDDEDLETAISKSDWVVGCNTYALVIALFSDKKVASTLPTNAPNCVLPFKKIIMMKSFFEN